MNDNALEDIRGKSEECELETILKSTVVGGGFTKKSVAEYFGYLKKQQQEMKDSYLEEINALKTEKERLIKENAELDADLNEAMQRIGDSEAKLEMSESELEILHSKANESEKNAAELRGLYDNASAENEELNRIIADMSGDVESQLRTDRCDVEFLSEEDFATVRGKVEELSDCAETLKKEFFEKLDDLSVQMKAIGDLAHTQLEKSRDMMEKMQISIQTEADRNELLKNEKDELSGKVQNLLEQNFALEKENTRLKAANSILQRRMESK